MSKIYVRGERFLALFIARTKKRFICVVIHEVHTHAQIYIYIHFLE